MQRFEAINDLIKTIDKKAVILFNNNDREKHFPIIKARLIKSSARTIERRCCMDI